MIAAKAPRRLCFPKKIQSLALVSWGRQDLSVVTAKGRTLVVYALPANSIKGLYVGYRADHSAVDELVGQAASSVVDL